MSVRLDEKEIKILQEIQYKFPVHSVDPYKDLSDRLKIEEEELIKILIKLKKAGVLRRVGFHLNYRAQGKKAALVAFDTLGRYKELARIVNKDPEVSHNYLRDHEVFDLWIIVKRRSKADIVNFARDIAEVGRISRWMVLFGERTYKLSVKYDLYKGISRAGNYSVVPERVPKPEELGIPHRLLKYVRELPITKRPYMIIANSLGLSERDVIDYIDVMLKEGILLDPGASLNGRLIGFNENALIALNVGHDINSLCEYVASIPTTTHVVLREAYLLGTKYIGKYCYTVIHSKDRSLIEKELKENFNESRFSKIDVSYSLADLRHLR